MAKYTGTLGGVTFATETLHVTNFTFTSSEPILDTTDSESSGWEEKIAKGITGTTASVSGHFDSDDTLPVAGDSGSAVFTFDTAVTVTQTMLVASIEKTVDVPGETPNQYSLELIGTGAVS